MHTPLMTPFQMTPGAYRVFYEHSLIFHFVILASRSLQLELAHANEINYDIHLANILV